MKKQKKDENGSNSSTQKFFEPMIKNGDLYIEKKHSLNDELAHTKKPCMMNVICDKIPARLVLYFLSWSGFLVSFMMRNDINFAITVMTKSDNATSNNSHSLLLNGNSTNHTADPNIRHSDYDQGEFDWNSNVRSWILSSFYCMYVLSQVVGGVATQKFGTKNVFGWSQFFTALGSLCIPWAASTHYMALIFVRCVQGFASGLTWPAMYAIVGPWIPPVERSRFMSSFQGFSIGIGLTYPLCGFIIEHFGWRPVFYTTGTIGMVWCVIWYFLAFNTPADHPRITMHELQYIELNVGQEIKEHQGMKVPWKSIFTSLPAWSIGVTTFGRIWVHYTFIMGGPSYMKEILNFDIQTNGLLSGLPFLCSYLSSVVFCYIADELVKRECMTLTNVRKIMTASSQIIPGLMVVAVGYLSDINVILTLWFLAVTMITASYAGAMASIVDIAPNLAGPVLAFAQTIHMTASFLSPVVSGFIVTNTKSLYQWQQSFILASIVAVVTYIMFQIYGTADIQPWNYPKKPVKSSEEEEVLSEAEPSTTNED